MATRGVLCDIPLWCF